MLKLYIRPYVHGKDLLSVADPDSEYGSGEQTESATVYLVTIVKNPNGPRFNVAKQWEYYGIVAKGDVKPVVRSDLPPEPKSVGVGDQEPWYRVRRFKAPWILQGHKDPEKFNVASNSQCSCARCFAFWFRSR
eukprot:Plantae.Rhodophyta-Rhodochaete_pulchella.ctg20080.p3 GENE.Plantae.Rhodophyta-Rhodochaete_pulchella.ctg20080~~Plantae.Rhodophyta-Rhodochaete_pulchella.ctg20080.p3  ORF type:complete len:133 (-),score=16.25 Plantae.Rhodophyta-Rhodochaete_pulchella.ctg20080:731-1129(-)